MNDIVDVQTNAERAEGLKAWGWVSYVLHLIVAVAASVGQAATWTAADSAGQGRTPEGSLAARVSPGAAADLRLDELLARWDAL